MVEKVKPLARAPSPLFGFALWRVREAISPAGVVAGRLATAESEKNDDGSSPMISLQLEPLLLRYLL